MPLSIFQTVEFYVVMVFLAAAVVGLAAMPSRRGSARQQLIAGELLSGATPSEPGIVAIVNDDGSMTIYRFGLENMCESGAYSLAVTFIGYDVTIDGDRACPRTIPYTLPQRGNRPQRSLHTKHAPRQPHRPKAYLTRCSEDVAVAD